MKRLDGLGSWRRTHYSTDVKPEAEGQTVTLFGLLASLRRQGGLIFGIVQDKEGIAQVTAHKDRVPEDVWSKLESLREYSYVGVRGAVKAMAKAPHGAEVVPEEVRVLVEPRRLPPYASLGWKAASIEKRLDLRAVDLRRPRAQAIFRVKHTVLQVIREFLSGRGYMEVNTPKIIASATEGGAALFPLLYYDKEAFLAQSPQLYKEQLVSAFDKVFEMGPVFRAEQFRTMRHLSEILMLDVEEAYVTYEDTMRLLEELIAHVVKEVSEKRGSDLEVLGMRLEVPNLPLPRLSYDETLKLLEAKGLKLAWGEDLATEALKAMGEVNRGFYYIYDWPTVSKAFYIKPKDEKPEVSESFDLMGGPVEVASGGSRVSSKRVLTRRLREKGLNPKSFEYHLKVFDYGMPPHSGFGLGVDRLIMYLTGEENVREVVLYPRDQTRLTP